MTKRDRAKILKKLSDVDGRQLEAETADLRTKVEAVLSAIREIEDRHRFDIKGDKAGTVDSFDELFHLVGGVEGSAKNQLDAIAKFQQYLPTAKAEKEEQQRNKRKETAERTRKRNKEATERQKMADDLLDFLDDPKLWKKPSD